MERELKKVDKNGYETKRRTGNSRLVTEIQKIVIPEEMTHIS